MTHRHNCRPSAAWLGLLGTLLLMPPAQAQMRGSGGFLPPASPAGTANSAFRRPGLRTVPPHRGHHHYRLYAPYYYPFYPYDYDDDGLLEPPPPPQRYQPEPAPATSPAPPAKPAESLVVELRGDHWVRLTSSGPEEALVASAKSAVSPGSTAKILPAFNSAAPAAALPPATLVFRDGHQEQASKYTIVGTTIYLKSDYWTSGSWNRKIPISDLDVPATLKLNHDRGANFSLPSRPSEIILRP